MEFDLNTYDLQDIVLALLMNNSDVLQEKETRVKELADLFAKINCLTSESNDWTLHFTVTQKEN